MYLDSSILVKRLSPEPESVMYSRNCPGQVLHTSALALTGEFAALLAKERAGKNAAIGLPVFPPLPAPN